MSIGIVVLIFEEDAPAFLRFFRDLHLNLASPSVGAPSPYKPLLIQSKNNGLCCAQTGFDREEIGPLERICRGFVKFRRMSSSLNFCEEVLIATLNFLQTESQSAQPNLHFCLTFSFPSSASLRLLLLLMPHVNAKEQDLRQSFGVNPSLLVQEDQ